MNHLDIDLARLLMPAEHHTPGDPQVTDWGALVAGGVKVITSPEQVRDLARLVESGDASVRDIERELRQWSL
ncbi:hypothetical protein [Streptomyces luteogriseus]|uniref:hypothetical protein n=1 Tax=Streptomyces luteogriseus TaxID=68233 RepID=UPI003679043D